MNYQRMKNYSNAAYDVHTSEGYSIHFGPGDIKSVPQHLVSEVNASQADIKRITDDAVDYTNHKEY